MSEISFPSRCWERTDRTVYRYDVKRNVFEMTKPMYSSKRITPVQAQKREALVAQLTDARMRRLARIEAENEKETVTDTPPEAA